MALGRPVTFGGGFAQGLQGGLQTGNEIINRNQRTDIFKQQVEQARQEQAEGFVKQGLEGLMQAADILRQLPPDSESAQGLQQMMQQTAERLKGEAERVGIDPARIDEGLQIAVAQSQVPQEAEFRNVSPGQTVLREGPQGVEPVFTAPAEGDESVQRLQRLGFSQQQIDTFLTNKERFAVSPDALGGVTIVDRFTGNVIRPEGEQAPSAEAPQQTVPEGGFEQGTGVSGALANIANTITDAFGAGMAFPGAEEAAQDLKTLQNQTELFLTASVPGRESNQVRERLRELTVTPNSVFQGDERARSRLVNTRDFIATELARIQQLLENPVGLNAKERSDAKANAGQLQTLLQAYDQIIEGFSGGSDLSDEDEALIQKYLGP